MQSEPLELLKIVSEVLKPWLGPLAKKVATLVVEKIQQATHKENANYKDRVITRNGYSVWIPLHLLEKNTATHSHLIWGKGHKLGHTPSSHTEATTQATYDKYKIEADNHKRERDAGNLQRAKLQAASVDTNGNPTHHSWHRR